MNENWKRPVNEISCPYCRYKGEALVETQKGGGKRYLCPRCGEYVKFRRKRV